MVQIGENEPTKIGILVKALNGDIETYTLEIYKENSNTNLKEVTVDGNKAEISKIAENTYEYTLDKKVDTITIGAIAEETKTKVGINTNEQEDGATYRKIKMEGKRIVVNIPVTAEDGTTKTYTLIINALPDNVNLLSVKVEGKVVSHGKGKKIIVFKMKAKKNYRRKQGHRQPYTKVEITTIKTATKKDAQTGRTTKPYTRKHFSGML